MVTLILSLALRRLCLTFGRAGAGSNGCIQGCEEADGRQGSPGSVAAGEAVDTADPAIGELATGADSVRRKQALVHRVAE